MDPWDRWVCRMCEYIYDPCAGDPKHGIEAGIPFKDLPKDWVCPSCGASKGNFKACNVYTKELYQ